MTMTNQFQLFCYIIHQTQSPSECGGATVVYWLLGARLKILDPSKCLPCIFYIDWVIELRPVENVIKMLHLLLINGKHLYNRQLISVNKITHSYRYCILLVRLSIINNLIWHVLIQVQSHESRFPLKTGCSKMLHILLWKKEIYHIFGILLVCNSDWYNKVCSSCGFVW